MLRADVRELDWEIDELTRGQIHGMTARPQGFHLCKSPWSDARDTRDARDRSRTSSNSAVLAVNSSFLQLSVKIKLVNDVASWPRHHTNMVDTHHLEGRHTCAQACSIATNPTSVTSILGSTNISRPHHTSKPNSHSMARSQLQVWLRQMVCPKGFNPCESL